MSEEAPHEGPDFTEGIATGDVAEGCMFSGRVGNEPALLARVDGRIYAIGGHCSHYHAPLAKGLIKDGAVLCPWHHARFDLKTGEAVGAPAFDPVACYDVQETSGMIYVKASSGSQAQAPAPSSVQRVVIVGGGAGGFAAAEMLRRKGFSGFLAILSADADAPYDRPNCSKDFLAGDAPEGWMPLRDRSYYTDNQIDLRLNAQVERLRLATNEVELRGGEALGFDVLILATGAEPQRPKLPGLDGENVFTLRSLEDARRLAKAVKDAKTVAVIGASFIGLEVAASLRKHGLEVHVAAPETVPLANVLGLEVGGWIKALHEKKGVIFHLGRKVQRYDGGVLTLDNDVAIAADVVVLGTGVKPRVALAEAAGLKVDNGVIVDDRLRAARNVYAIGDIARYPEPITGKLARVEHWVHAERQGQHVARQILGEDAPYSSPPFFWTAQYDEAVRYSGHAEDFDPPVIDGSLEAYDASVLFQKDRALLAVAALGRDQASLAAEAAFETVGAT